MLVGPVLRPHEDCIEIVLPARSQHEEVTFLVHQFCCDPLKAICTHRIFAAEMMTIDVTMSVVLTRIDSASGVLPSTYSLLRDADSSDISVTSAPILPCKWRALSGC